MNTMARDDQDDRWVCECGESFYRRDSLDAHAFLRHEGASLEDVVTRSPINE